MEKYAIHIITAVLLSILILKLICTKCNNIRVVRVNKEPLAIQGLGIADIIQKITTAGVELKGVINMGSSIKHLMESEGDENGDLVNALLNLSQSCGETMACKEYKQVLAKLGDHDPSHGSTILGEFLRLIVAKIQSFIKNAHIQEWAKSTRWGVCTDEAEGSPCRYNSQSSNQWIHGNCIGTGMLQFTGHKTCIQGSHDRNKYHLSGAGKRYNACDTKKKGEACYFYGGKLHGAQRDQIITGRCNNMSWNCPIPGFHCCEGPINEDELKELDYYKQLDSDAAEVIVSNQSVLSDAAVAGIDLSRLNQALELANVSDSQKQQILTTVRTAQGTLGVNPDTSRKAGDNNNSNKDTYDYWFVPYCDDPDDSDDPGDSAALQACVGSWFKTHLYDLLIIVGSIIVLIVIGILLFKAFKSKPPPQPTNISPSSSYDLL
jgi:hypothetical protein